MDDELEDKIFYQTFTSHMKILSKFAIGFSPTSFSHVVRFFRLYLTRPEVLICGFLFFLLMLYLQATEVWSRGLVGRIQSTFTSFGLRGGKRIDLTSQLSSSPAEKHSWELKGDQSAVYSVKGRRPNMEDRYILNENINNNTGISMFAIFDGHGGQFAADYAKDILIQNLYNKIVEAHNIVTGKTVVQPSWGAGLRGGNSKQTDSDKKEANEDYEKEKKPAEDKLQERRNSFRKSYSSFTEESLGKATSNKAPPEPDIYKLNNLRPLNKDDLFNPSGAKNSQQQQKVPQTQEAKYYVENGKINFGKLVTDEVLAADHKLVETTKKITSYAGTTALIAIVEGSQLVVANVGDSRGVMCDSRGNAIPLSFDHKPQQVRERKRIHEAGGFIAYKGVWRVAGVLATSRAMGDYPLKENNLVIADPDILTFNLADHKPMFLIFASDGLWDTFSNEEAVAFIRERIKEPHFGAKSITLQSYVRGSTDNITVMVVVFDGTGFRIGSSTG